MDRRDFIKSMAAVCAAGIPAQITLPAQTTSVRNPVNPPLAKRTLGKTGVQISSLIIGGVAGMQKPRTDDFDPAVLANTALDLGITYFDTAPSYNNGQSESNYGEVVARRRKEVFLATKTGQRSYDGAMKEVEASLKRLRTDRVDLLQIHGATPSDDLAKWDKPDGVLTALRKLRDQKVTRFIGVTGHDSAEVMRRAIAMYEFDTILTTFNPTDKRRPFRELVLPVALEKKMGIIAMKIMGGGLGSLANGKPIKNDGRSNHDEARQQANPATLIRYGLSLPISAVNVGMGSLEELAANVRAAREFVAMPPDERGQLEKMMA